MTRAVLSILWLYLAQGSVTPAEKPAETDHTQFLYLSDQRIATIEVADSSSVILNYINLGDSYEMIEAPMLVLLDRWGRRYKGHLISLDDQGDSSHPFAVTDLVRPGEFSGYLVRGNFGMTAPPERVLFQVSGRILEFEALSAEDFELVAARIGELDLGAEDRKWAIERAGFKKGYGNLIFAGTEEARALEDYFSKSEMLPPVPIATPKPRLPTTEADRPDPVAVGVKVIVSLHGGLRDIRLAESLDPKLDEIALETVRNSWVFLPAISKNEVVETEVTLNVVFRRQ